MKQAAIIALLCFYSMCAMDQACNPAQRLECKRDPEFCDNIQFLYVLKKQQRKLKDKIVKIDNVLALVQQHGDEDMMQFLEEEKCSYISEIKHLDLQQEHLSKDLKGVTKKITQRKTVAIIEVAQ